MLGAEGARGGVDGRRVVRPFKRGRPIAAVATPESLLLQEVPLEALLFVARQALLFQALLLEAIPLWHDTSASSISIPPLLLQGLVQAGCIGCIFLRRRLRRVHACGRRHEAGERRAWYDKRVEIMVNDMQPPPSSKPKPNSV